MRSLPPHNPPDRQALNPSLAVPPLVVLPVDRKDLGDQPCVEQVVALTSDLLGLAVVRREVDSLPSPPVDLLDQDPALPCHMEEHPNQGGACQVAPVGTHLPRLADRSFHRMPRHSLAHCSCDPAARHMPHLVVAAAVRHSVAPVTRVAFPGRSHKAPVGERRMDQAVEGRTRPRPQGVHRVAAAAGAVDVIFAGAPPCASRPSTSAYISAYGQRLLSVCARLMSSRPSPWPLPPLPST